MQIKVEIPGKSTVYNIVIERGLIDSCAQYFENYDQVVVVTDSNVEELFGEKISNVLPDAEKIIVPAGESSKCFAQVENLCEQLAQKEIMRNAVMVCFGGGVIGDLAGFVASIYMRGIDYVQFPTTLVAMVDSSIGGKTGINLKEGKNLVGAFKQPKMILVDPDLVSELPRPLVVDGLGEMVKHALFADLSLLDEFKNDPVSEASIARSAKIKVDIIQDDVFESGKRKWLNVGHTTAHAIEMVSNYEISHGQAVLIGTFWESFIAKELGVLSDLETVENAFKDLDLEYIPQKYDLSEMWEIMLNDKKNIHPDKCVMSFISMPGSQVEVQEIDKETFVRLSEELYAKYL